MPIKIKSEEIITLEDGYKYYWPTDYPYGAFPAHTLREIADQLDAMNKEWDDQLNEYMANHA